MSPRERLRAAARGGETDRKAVILRSGETPSDAAFAADAERMVLASVDSPLGRDPGVLETLREDPARGESVLDELVASVNADIQAAFDGGAEGILYRLAGAHPSQTTPMQYGGHFLERDREILAGLEEAPLVVLWVEGGEETYLDFVSDLPAHLFAWDAVATQVSPAEIRAMRTGALASNHPDADVWFAADAAELATLELTAHV